MKLTKLAACIAASTLLIACGSDNKSSNNDKPQDTFKIPAQVTAAKDSISINVANVKKLVDTNANIALAAYEDSVTTAKALKTALAALKATPTADTLKAAKQAWLVAREPYGQTEVYRFRSSPIDSTSYPENTNEDGPEGAINAWPLGEALIDYVKVNTSDFGDDQVGVPANQAGVNGNGALTAAQAAANTANNIIGQSAITIDADLLDNTATEAAGERDVIAGYHAIEFLLWGQDLNTTNQAVTDGTDRDKAVNTGNMGGQRPVSDFVSTQAGDKAARRHQYLEVAVDKLIADLEQVRDGWKAGAAYRTAFTTVTTEAEAKKRLEEILTGMGTLSEGELGGERMQIAYAGNSQEDEHSCFSDNTHRDVVLNALGVANSYYGDYAGYDSTLNGTANVTTNAVKGYGFDDYLADASKAAMATGVKAFLDLTQTSYNKVDAAARDGKPFDVLIMPANRNATNPVRETILALNAQSTQLQNLATGLGLGDVVEDDASGCNTQNPDAACPE